MQPEASAGPSQEDVFTVRIPRDKRKKFTMMKFGSGGAGVEFSKLGDQSVKLERENNLKEYKTANDLDLLPKFGAGSEYGRDLKEESRRKKYGIMLKKYNPDDQPWLLKVGQGKQAKRYKGVREGTIAENTSYYIFTKAADGAFEAFPVDEWYTFNPIIRYKYLTSEEAEEEFNRRDSRLNYFNIMAKKRTKKEDDGADVDDDEDGKGSKKFKKKKKPAKDLILTDMEEWNDLGLSDDDDDGDDNDEEEKEDDDNPKKKKKGKMPLKKGTKNSKKNSDDEAVEESDEGDYDDREVDYMSDSGDSSSLSGAEPDDKEKKYVEKGVDEEDGLRNILDSGAEDEEEEEAEKEEEETEEKEEKKEEKKKGDNDSSSSSSEDDSDIEKEATAIFSKSEKKEKKENGSNATKAESTSSSVDKSKDKALKRKMEKSNEGKPPSAKKHKREESEGITEDAIRRYLQRKPMTTLDLLQKFKKLNMSNEKLTHVIAQLLKKINPDKKMINKKLYLSLKKPE